MIVNIGGNRVQVQVLSSGLAFATEGAALQAVLDQLESGALYGPEPDVVWAHNYASTDGDGPMWRRAIAAGIAAGKTVKGRAGSYELGGTASSVEGVLAFSTAVNVRIVCDNGQITFTAPSGNSKALLHLSGGANFYCDNVVWDATNVSTNFGIKCEGAGDFSFGKMEVKKKGWRFVGTNGSIYGDELTLTDIQGHGCTAGSATGEAFGYSNGGYIKLITANNITGSDFNWSATKVLKHLRIDAIVGRWTKWESDGEAFPTRYAGVRLGNGTSNISIGYVFTEGKYRGVRLTDTDNCWVEHFDFKNLIGPAILYNRKDQRARNSGVLNVTGFGPCRGNRRNDIGVSDKDSELIAGEGDRAGVIQEGEGWTLGKMSVSGDENQPGSGIITASTASATVTNKDSDYVGQDFNCFDDVVVGDLLFTTAGVVLGKVLSKGSKTYWTDAGGTISQPSAAGANHATQSLTLTGNSAATVTAVAYEQRTPDGYFYVANTGNITISGVNITNNSLTAATGTITTTTSSATVTGVGTDFDGQAAIGKSLFRASDDTYIGQIADIDESLPNTVLRLAANAAVALTGGAFKIGYSFVTQFEPGDLIFDSSLNYAGVVNTVPTPLAATLTASTLAPAVTNAAFRYGKLYKCAVGLEVAESATETNVNLADVQVLGATTQHTVAQPNCIKATPAQSITVAQLATLTASERRGERRYISDMDYAGWVVSDGADWIKENPNGIKTYSNTTDFSPTYIQYAPSLRLTGNVGAGSTAIITLPTTSVPNGAAFTFFSIGTNAGTWQIGSTLTRVRGGQWATVVYDKTATSWRLVAAGNQSDRIPKITRASGTPEAAIIGEVGDLYVNLAGTLGTLLYIKETGAGTNTGWVAQHFGPRPTTYAAMAALTASSNTNQTFLVTDVGTNGTLWRSTGSAFVPLQGVSSTWAALPTASTCSGLQVFVTDVGSAGCLFRSNGSAWVPIGRITSTWASLPSASTYSGLEAFVSDIGVSGSSWRSNGTIWVPMAVICLYDNPAQSAAHTGTTTSTYISSHTATIPAGLMGATRSLRVQMVSSSNNDASVKTIQVRHGASLNASGTNCAQIDAASSLTQQITGIVSNTAAAVQKVMPISLFGNNGTSTSALTAGAVDTAVVSYVKPVITLADATDTVYIERMIVELLP